jgi:hypothetical protein
MRAILVAAFAIACRTPAPAPALAVASPGSASPTAPIAARPKPARTAEVVVTITGPKVVMNDVEISGKPAVTDLVAVFGKPDRTWDQGGANKVHTWDALGVIVYEPFDGRAISVTFPYKPMKQAFDPKMLFGGSITVDGRKLTAATTLAQVKTWPRATMPYSQSSVVFDKGDVHVFTIEEQPGTIDLVEVGFWQRGKADPGEEPEAELDRAGAIELSCNGGDARMCTRLALLHQVGVLAAKDPARTFELAKQACMRGDAFGCIVVGNMYEAGRGTARSQPEATAAWQRACKLGNCSRAAPRR